MNKEQVQALLKELEIRPSKSRGQNFLLDESYVQEMVEAAEIGSNEPVLEVGPGLGVLTKELQAMTNALCVVELDKKIAPYIKKQFVNNQTTLIEGDVLSHQTFHRLVAWLAKQKNELTVPDPKEDGYKEVLESLDHSYKLVANLPYQITSRLLRQFLTALPRPSRLVVMVQKEVAERMTAPAGEMSLLSLAVQTASSARIITQVPKDAFFPAPKIDSAIILCDLMHPNVAYAGLEPEEQKLFWRLAKAGFAARRKQLKKNLASLPFQVDWERLISRQKLVPAVRAQELTVDDWVALTKALLEENKG